MIPSQRDRAGVESTGLKLNMSLSETLYFPRPEDRVEYDDYLRDLSLPVGLREVRRIAFAYFSVNQGRREWEVYNIGVLLERFENLDEVVLLQRDRKRDVRKSDMLMLKDRRGRGTRNDELDVRWEFVEELAREGLALRRGVKILTEVWARAEAELELVDNVLR